MATPVTIKRPATQPQVNPPQNDFPEFDYQYENPFANDQDPKLPPGAFNEFPSFGPGWIQKYGEVYPTRRSSQWRSERRLFWNPDGSLDEEKQKEYDSDEVAAKWEKGDPTFFTGNPQKDEQDYVDYMYGKVDKKLTKQELARIDSIAKDYEKKMKAGDPEMANVTDPQKAAKKYFYDNLYRRDIPSYKQYVNYYYKKPPPVKEEPQGKVTGRSLPQGADGRVYRTPQEAPNYDKEPMSEDEILARANYSKKQAREMRGQTAPGRPTREAKVRVKRYNDNFSRRPGPQNKAAGPRVVRRRLSK